MKLFIFEIWQGYVQEDYYPIVATNELQAREILKEKVMPDWINRIKSTTNFIRETYSDSKYSGRYGIYGYKKQFKDANEESDAYYKEQVSSREVQLKECKFVSVSLPITKIGYVEELFHSFIE
jgi:hypothetical protein